MGKGSLEDSGNQAQDVYKACRCVSIRNKEQTIVMNSFFCGVETYYNALESGTELRYPIREINLLIKLLRSPVIIWCAYYPFCLFILLVTSRGTVLIYGRLEDVARTLCWFGGVFREIEVESLGK